MTDVGWAGVVPAFIANGCTQVKTRTVAGKNSFSGRDLCTKRPNALKLLIIQQCKKIADSHDAELNTHTYTHTHTHTHT